MACYLATIRKSTGSRVPENNNSNTLILLGEIVSIYEKDGIQYAKIHYDPGFVDIIFQEIQDVFLNDRVIVNSRLEVENVSTKIENGGVH